MITFGSLFTGTAALDQAAADVLGCTPVWFCDNDPAACKLLAHHYPNTPNLGDITAVDWSTVAPVDILGGGFPCQDVSLAGRRVGMAPGTRSGLWTHMADAISCLRPRLVLVENVRGLLNAKADSDVEPCAGCVGSSPKKPPLRALGAVLGDLADLGYDAIWCGVRASDIGAPHQRFRVFVAAADPRSEAIGVRSGLRAGRADEVRRRRPDDDAVPPAPDSAGDRRDEGWPEPAGQQRGPELADGRRDPAADTDGHPVREQPEWVTGRCGAPVAEPPGAGARLAAADTDRPGLEVGDGVDVPERATAERGDSPAQEWGRYGAAIRRWERILGRPAPTATVVGGRGGRVLSPAFVEWMMGLPVGHITAVPGLSRNDMLKLGGNGIVPLQAAAAIRHLVRELPQEVAA